MSFVPPLCLVSCCFAVSSLAVPRSRGGRRVKGCMGWRSGHRGRVPLPPSHPPFHRPPQLYALATPPEAEDSQAFSGVPEEAALVAAMGVLCRKWGITPRPGKSVGAAGAGGGMATPAPSTSAAGMGTPAMGTPAVGAAGLGLGTPLVAE